MGGKPRTIRRLTALLTAPVLLLAAACGDDGREASGERVTPAPREADVPGGFEASPAFLRSVVERSAAEPYRFEMWMSFAGEPDITRPPLAFGEQDGDQVSMQMDVGVVFRDMAEQVGEPLPAEMAGLDMTIETVGDATTAYMRMPFLAELSRSLGPASGAEMELLAAFEDWVYIDMTRLSDGEFDELQDMIGARSLEPAEVVDILADVEGARELEPIEVRGETMAGLAAEVSAAELLVAQGVDLEQLRSLMLDDEFEAVLDLTMDVSTWVDSDGYLGRMSFVLDFAEILQAEGLDPQEMAEMETLLGGTDVTIVMDLFDYGDPGIAIEFPADATDVTDDMEVLAGL